MKKTLKNGIVLQKFNCYIKLKVKILLKQRLEGISG